MSAENFLRVFFIGAFLYASVSLNHNLRDVASAIRERNAAPVYEDESYTPARCTTDTGCMEKFGGNGGPEPKSQEF